MEKPNSIATRRVAVQYVIGAVDGADADDEPDFIPARGVVEFTASVAYTPYPVVSGPNPLTVLNAKITGVLDSEGYLCTPDPSSPTLPGKRGVRLVCTDNVDGSVANWTWTATPRFVDANGTRIPDVIPPFSFYLPADSDPNAPDLDLTTVQKVPASQGIGNAQAEALASLASAAAVSSADSAERALAAAEEALGAAGATDDNVSALVDTTGSATRMAVASVVDAKVADEGFVSVDDNYDFPAPVAARQAARLGDATTAEGKAVGAQVATVRKSLPAARPARGARLPLTMITGSVYTPGGGVSATDVVLGSTNYYVQTAGDATFASWHRWSAMSPQNLVGKGLVFMAKVTNGHNLAYLTVSASSDNGMAGYFQHRIPVPRDGKSPLREGEWAPVYVPWSAMNLMPKVGTPDASAIVAIKLTPSDIGGGKSARLEIGSLIGVYTDPAATGSVMWSFDDSYVEAMPAAVKLASVGHRGVLHPIVERIDTTSAFLTTAQVLRLQDLYGWEIGAHCMTNAQHVSLVGQSRAQIESMLLEIREWQRSIGAESNAFAYPIGPFDKNAVEAVGAHYGYARTNDELPTPSRLPQPLQASAAALSATANSLATMKVVLDQVAANKSMMNIVIHRLVNGATSAQNEWSMSDFNALVDHAVSLGLKNVTTAQVLALT